MALGAGPDGNRTVRVLLFEFGAVVTAQAELRLVLTHVEQVTAGTSVRPVAGDTIPLLYRRMYHLFLFLASWHSSTG